MILQTPKGFRDFLPEDALKRKFVLGKITQVFEKFGFDPLETPTLEYEETLIGKYGEEEKLIYKFETNGGDKVALKYDQTVPLARVVAQYGSRGEQKLPAPFKRYQIQSAFRGENTQKGRYREFLQCDADIVGVSTPLADAEILALVYEIYQNLGLEVIIKINDRSLFAGIENKFLASVDKFTKIGEGAVLKEIEDKGLTAQEALELFGQIQLMQPTENLKQTMALFKKMGYPEDALMFDSMMVRGLNYYTGLIIEVVLKSAPKGSSIGGGGRYDKLIGSFIEGDFPAIGFSVGLDRTIEAMEEAGVLKASRTVTKVLVTIFSPDLADKSLEVAAKLRAENIPTEIWLDPESKFDKQLKYANQKGIPFAVIIGPDEVTKNQLVLKNLDQRTQETLTFKEILPKLK